MMDIAGLFVRKTVRIQLINSLYVAVALIAFLISPNPVLASDITIQQPTILEPVPGSPVASGYLKITNNSDKTDRLIAAKTDFAAMAQIHEMKIVNDIMKMRQLADGLEIPAGGSVVLKSGGSHIMFMRLKERPKAGENRKVTLTFENAGVIELAFSVKTRAEIKNQAN